jgi:hypothetical protein
MPNLRMLSTSYILIKEYYILHISMQKVNVNKNILKFLKLINNQAQKSNN